MGEINHIFDARTKRTAQRCYDKVLALCPEGATGLAQRETFVTQTPDEIAIFDFLERHWPYLVNAIEIRIIPTTKTTPQRK